MRDWDDADKRERDDEEPETEVPHRGPADLAQRFADGPRDAERDAAGGLARDDDPVAAAARRAGCRDERRPLDAERLQMGLVGRLGRVQRARPVDGERDFTLVAPREAQDHRERAVQVQHRIGTPDDAAVLLNVHLDVASFDADRQGLPVPARGGLARERFGHGVESLLPGRELLLDALFDHRADLRIGRGDAGGRGGARRFLDDPRNVHDDDLGSGWRRNIRRPSAVPRAAGPVRCAGWGRKTGPPHSPAPPAWVRRDGDRDAVGIGYRRSGRDVRRRVKLHAIHQRGGVAEQRRDARAHRLRIGIEGTLRRCRSGDEQAVQPAPDVGRNHFHAPADVGGTLRRLALCRQLERVDGGQVGDQRHRGKRDDRHQDERNDQPCSQRHGAGPAASV